MSQEVVALGIVAVAFGFIAVTVFRRYFAESVAKRLLKAGHVKLAMRIHKHSQHSGPGCPGCKS